MSTYAWLSIMWKSNLSNKIKRDLFNAVAVSTQLYEFTTQDTNKTQEKKLNGNYTRMLHAVLKKS